MNQFPIKRTLTLALLFFVFLPSFAQKVSIDALLKEGRVHFFDKQYEQALASFEKALAIDAKSLEAQLGKMDALGALRRPIEGLAKNVSSKQTSRNESLILDANEKIWKRKFNEALSNLDQALEKNSKAYMAHYLAAFIHRRSRKFDQALDHLKKAQAIEPNFPETNYLLGEVLLATGKTDEALLAFQKYLEMVPQKGKRFDSVNATIAQIGGR